MSFNGHFIFIIGLVVFTTFINFINSFRFDTSHNSHKFKFFALYIFLIIQVRFKCFALWNRIPLFFNGQLVSSLSYPGLLVNAYITMTLSNKYTNIFESLVF